MIIAFSMRNTSKWSFIPVSHASLKSVLEGLSFKVHGSYLEIKTIFLIALKVNMATQYTTKQRSSEK